MPKINVGGVDSHRNVFYPLTNAIRYKKPFSVLIKVEGVMKIVSATPETPGMTKDEVDRFLESKLMLQMSTIDEQGEPNIQPVWFYYDKNRIKLLITTSKLAKKTQNLRKKPILYFSIDDENFPYKGVKGKGSVTLVEDPGRTVTEGDQISMKYLGTLDHPIAKMITEHSKKGENIVIEIIQSSFLHGIMVNRSRNPIIRCN